MKIRIQTDSIRIRLSPAESIKFSEGELLKETIHFPGQNLLHWILEPSATASEISAKFEPTCVVVSVPMNLVRIWWNPEVNSLENKQMSPAGPTQTLHLLVEKDFDS